MSILAKKGQRALTQKQQKRHNRNVLTRRRWKAWRTFLHYTTADTRAPIDRAFRGIAGRVTPEQRDRALHARVVGRASSSRPNRSR